MPRCRAWIPTLLLLALVPAVCRPGLAEPRAAESRLAAVVHRYAMESCACRLQEDPDLAGAAREFGEILATGVVPDTHEFLRQSLSARGVMDPFPYVFYGSAPPERLGELVQRLEDRLRRLPVAELRLYTHMGVGVHARSRRQFLSRRVEWFVAVLLTQRAISFSPLPLDPRPGERFLFEGEVYPPFHEPQVLLTRPDGNTDVLENFAIEPRGFRTYVHFGAQHGEYRLEVMGRYDMGPRVLALASLQLRDAGESSQYEVLLAAARSGTLRPAAKRTEPAGLRSPSEAEAELLSLLNRDRQRAGVPSLTPHPELGAMARAHSADMRDHGFFAHVSPNTGRLTDRAEQARIPFRRISENIAVSTDVRSAHEALMRSPGHRMNLLDPAFSHVGVGVAVDRDDEGRTRVHVTENFLVPPR